MNARFPFVVSVVIAVASIGFWAGCGQPDQTGGSSQAAPQPEPQGDHGHDHAGEHSHDHDEAVDPHDMPITDEQKQQLKEETAKFADAIGRITKFRDAIEEETKNGIPQNPFEAHQALDRVDLVLQWLPGIARDSAVPKEHWEAVNISANELRESFEKVHQNIDDKADPDFASVREQIDAKIATLLTIAK